MKASDSVNSLTELTHEKSCFICLSPDPEQGEPLVDSKLLRNCGCKFEVHPACWNEWLKGKSDYDCPICHKDSMMRIKILPNPVMVIANQYQDEPPQRTICWKVVGCGLATTIAVILLTALTQRS